MNIFIDLDGTLLDSRRRLHRLFCDLVQDERLSEEEYWKLKRTPRSHGYLLEQRFGWSPERIDEFSREWLERIESDDYLRLDVPYGFARIALERLAREARLYLLTSRQLEQQVRGQLERTGLLELFADVIVTGRARTKAQALREFGVPLHSDDVLVGDTSEDIAAARELNIRAVCVANGFREASYLATYEPDCIYADLLAFAEARSQPARVAKPV